jgi:competence protein ComEA
MTFDRRKIELVAYAVAAFVVVLLAARMISSGDDSGAARVSLAAPRGAAAPSKTSTAPPAPGHLLVVDVAGEVRRPGVYRVPAGSRADAAVQQAGGVTRHGESAAVNLAMPLRDGQQIVVPRRGAAPVAPAGGAPGSSAPGGSGVATGTTPAAPISLSTASVEQLDTLDGIGPTLAGRIVQYRDAHGGFRSIEELRQVDGIGEKRFESLRKGLQP